MHKLLASVAATLLTSGIAFTPMAAVAASDTDKAALQKTTADCKAQVKEYAQYPRLIGISGTRCSKNASTMPLASNDPRRRE
jgi:hypothetical protein